MESLVNISKAPLDDVETLSESLEMVTVTSLPEEEESIKESRGDVVTTAAKFLTMMLWRKTCRRKMMTRVPKPN